MKKFLICFALFFVVASSVFVCSAISKDDISTSYAVLPDSVINKCIEISDKGNGYTVVKCINDGHCITNYSTPSSGILPKRYDFDYFIDNYLVFETTTDVQTNTIVGNYSNISEKLNLSDILTANYSHIYLYDNNGLLITSSPNEFYKYSSGTFNTLDYSFIATNVGVYNSDNKCLFYRSTLPLGQTVRLNFKEIIRSISSVFGVCLIIFVGFIGIRKAIFFIRSLIEGA